MNGKKGIFTTATAARSTLNCKICIFILKLRHWRRWAEWEDIFSVCGTIYRSLRWCYSSVVRYGEMPTAQVVENFLYNSMRVAIQVEITSPLTVGNSYAAIKYLYWSSCRLFVGDLNGQVMWGVTMSLVLAQLTIWGSLDSLLIPDTLESAM